MLIDLWQVYSFIKRLATPFRNWEAFRLGIIDADGNILKKRKEFTTRAESNAFGYYDLLLLNIKKTLAKIPGGSTRLASYSAALYLIKEHKMFTDEAVLSEDVSDFSSFETDYLPMLEQLLADEVTVSAGSGDIAGLGVGPDGEPGRPAKYQPKKKKKLRDILNGGDEL